MSSNTSREQRQDAGGPDDVADATPGRWMSLAEAAAAIGVHSRTVERRIAAGKLDNRRSADGQVQVFVPLPDSGSSEDGDAGQSSRLLAEAVRDQAEQQVSLAVTTSDALIRQAHAVAANARQDAGRAWDETHAARRSGRRGWTTAAGVGVIAAAALAVGVRMVTVSELRLEAAGDQLRRAQLDAERAGDERDTMRGELEQARVAAAVALARAAPHEQQHAGDLAGDDAAPAARPTTRPGELLARLWSDLARNE